MIKDSNIRLTITIDKDLYADLQSMATKLGISLSKLISLLCKMYTHTRIINKYDIE